MAGRDQDEFDARFSEVLGKTPEELRAMLGTVRGDPDAGTVRSLLRYIGPERPELRRPHRPEPALYRIRIDLARARPPIWRRLDLRSDLTLDVVHEVIQVAFDWRDSHLHRFSLGGGPFDRTSQVFLGPYEEGEGDGVPTADVRLDEVLQETGDELVYLYDYGDHWEHVLRLEKVLPFPAGNPADVPAATYVTGRRAAPPEDGGGWIDDEDLAGERQDPAVLDEASLAQAVAAVGAPPPRFVDPRVADVVARLRGTPAGRGAAQPGDHVGHPWIDEPWRRGPDRGDGLSEARLIENGGVLTLPGQVLVVDPAATVLRWSGAPARDVGGGRHVCGVARREGQDLLQTQHVLPVIAVVVEIYQFVAGLLQHLVEAHVGGRYAVPLTLLVGTEEHLRCTVERTAAEREAVQVGVPPIEGHLDHLMDDVEGEVGAQVEPAPDRRASTSEIDANAVERGLGAVGAAQLGALRADVPEQTPDRSRIGVAPDGAEHGAQLLRRLSEHLGKTGVELVLIAAGHDTTVGERRTRHSTRMDDMSPSGCCGW